MTATPKPSTGGLPPPPPPAATKAKPPPVPRAPDSANANAAQIPAPATAPQQQAELELATREAARAALEIAASLGDERIPPTAAAEPATPSVLATPAQPLRERQRSASDLLFELDAPARPVSRDLELAFSPDALPPAAGPAPAPVTPPAELASDQAAAADLAEVGSATAVAVPLQATHPSLAQLAVLSPLPSDEKATTPEAQQQQRFTRTVTRVLTCRDSFRWMGSLGVAEQDRKTVARLLMELDPVLDKHEGKATVVKEPETALKDATPDQLEAIERLLAPIEDKLLALDELIPADKFLPQLENRKQSRKLIARYGRLLASRRFNAGARRDRFELIASFLLTATNDAGRRLILPPDRARPVLDHLIGGMSRKQRDNELSEAVSYLKEMLVRLAELKTHEDFFDSEYFLDVHGYKVSMRDQLLSPEFLYLSVLINTEIHNRLEGWIADQERLYDSNQITAFAIPREQIMRRVREQEAAVGDIFGVKSRSPLPAKGIGGSNPPPANKSKPEKAKKRERASFSFDRNFALLMASLLVLAAAGGYIAFSLGAIRLENVQALEDSQLARISGLLGPGWIKGAGKARRFEGELLRRKWLALDGRRRTEQADHIAETLRGLGIKNARIGLNGRPAIEIHEGYVSFVLGGKL